MRCSPVKSMAFDHRALERPDIIGRIFKRSWWRRRSSAYGADERGVTAVEFAMVVPVLLLLLSGIIETGLVFTADIILKNATYEAARTGRTGFVAANTTQDITVKAIIRDKASVMMDAASIAIDSRSYSGFDTLKKPEPFVDANANGVYDDGENFIDVNENGVWDADQGALGYGGANEVVLYTVTYPWHFFTPLMGTILGKDGVLNLTATAVVQNEPY